MYRKNKVLPSTIIKLFAVALIALTSVYASAVQEYPGDMEDQGEESYFFSIGEGYTATSASDGIDAAVRASSTPTILRICEKSARPVKLVAPKDVVLHVFESLPFDRLKVLAVDAFGKPLPPVPIAVSADDRHCLIRTSAINAQAGNWVVPIRPGRFHFRVSTICKNTTQTSVEIQAEVLDEMKIGLPSSTEGTR